MSEDKHPDPPEAGEAADLAAALDGEPRDAPEDTLETAELLRSSADRMLAPERREAVLTRILEGSRAELERRARGQAGAWRRWLLPAGGLAAAGAAAAVLLVWLPASAPACLPAPGRPLLEAQAAAAGGSEPAAARLRSAMRDYRERMLAELSARYASRGRK
ncbi:MAG: hypothetical protein JXR96_17015 [Deltaproteobacteria bacterium]|nr:hypothetical protein [Deltaproteobacteria bacterium]